jgi:hypothetical protein
MTVSAITGRRASSGRFPGTWLIACLLILCTGAMATGASSCKECAVAATPVPPGTWRQAMSDDADVGTTSCESHAGTCVHEGSLGRRELASSCDCGCSPLGTECPVMATSARDDIVLSVSPCPCAGHHSHTMVTSFRITTGLAAPATGINYILPSESLLAHYSMRSSQHIPLVSHGPPRSFL